MPVKNIECQIAQAQLGRYLAGEGMAGEAVRQLEIHLAKCPECKRVLDEKRRSLLASLQEAPAESHPAPASAPNSAPAKPPTAPAPAPQVNGSASNRLVQTMMAKAAAVAPAPSAPAKATVGPNWKPVAYGAALAAVLIGMSYFGKSGLFGSRAAASLPEASASPSLSPEPSASQATRTNPTTTPDSTTEPVQTPVATHSRSPKTKRHRTKPVTRTTTPKPAKPPVHHRAGTERPAPVRHHNIVAAPRHLTPKPVKARAHVRHNRIRVYDSSGKPIVH